MHLHTVAVHAGIAYAHVCVFMYPDVCEPVLLDCPHLCDKVDGCAQRSVALLNTATSAATTRACSRSSSTTETSAPKKCK